MKKLKLRVLIRTSEGKQQEFTLEGEIKNPDINVERVAFDIEHTINHTTKYRCHATVEE